MSDFLKWLTLCIAVLAITYLLTDHEQRIVEIKKAIPLPCRPVQSLLKNRPIPPIHSYARPARVCEEQP